MKINCALQLNVATFALKTYKLSKKKTYFTLFFYYSNLIFNESSDMLIKMLVALTVKTDFFLFFIQSKKCMYFQKKIYIIKKEDTLITLHMFYNFIQMRILMHNTVIRFLWHITLHIV